MSYSKENNINHTTKNRKSHNEEDCQDKVCNDVKRDLKFWLKKDPVDPKSECPVDKNTLGKYTWSLMHTMASKFPKKPTQEDKDNMREFIRLMSILYPCSYCAKEFREDIKEMPPKLESRDSLTLWFCNIHNKTNAKLRKPQFDCSKIDERWRTGWKDGTCDEF